MAYYSPTGAPVQQTRGTSPSIRNEFALIAAGFALLPVPAAIAAGYSNYAGLDTGAANAYVVSLQPTVILAYTDGMTISFKAANANTGTSTVNLNSLGVISITRPDGTALQAGDITANGIVALTYNSTTGTFLVGANLLTYVSQAAASASAAAASAGASAGSAIASQTSAVASLGYYLTFQTVYLGSKTTDPTLDNQGNPLITGALYFNSALGQMKTYTGSAWVQAFVPASIYLLLTGGTMTGALNWATTVTLASAATVNIGAAASNDLIISGATTITAFDTIAAGAMRKVKFTGALTLTHNATSLILPGAANITTANGDTAQFTSLGGGNWKCDWYNKTSGLPIVSTNGLVCIATATASNNPTIDFTGIDSTYDEYVLEIINAIPAAGNTALFLTSSNGGSSYDNGAGNYSYNAMRTQASSTAPAGAGSTSNNSIILTPAVNIDPTTVTGGLSGTIHIFDPASAASYKKIQTDLSYGADATSDTVRVVGTGMRLSTTAVNAIRFQFTSQNTVTGKFKLYGVRKTV